MDWRSKNRTWGESYVNAFLNIALCVTLLRGKDRKTNDTTGSSEKHKRSFDIIVSEGLQNNRFARREGMRSKRYARKPGTFVYLPFQHKREVTRRAHTSMIPGRQDRGYIPCHLPPHFRLGAMSNRVPACILRAIDHPERLPWVPGGSFTVREFFRVLRTPILPNPFKKHLFTSKFSEQSCQPRRAKLAASQWRQNERTARA